MKTRRSKKRSPHNRRTRGLCAALVFIFIFGAALSLPATASGVVSASNTAKISADLLARMEASDDPDEMFPVNVWLNTISASDIDAELQAAYGIELQSFENEEIYNTRTLPAFEEAVAQKLSMSKDAINQSMSKTMIAEKSNEARAFDSISLADTLRTKDQVFAYVSDEIIQQYGEKERSIFDLYVLAKSNEFREARNESVKNLIAEQDTIFLNKIAENDFILKNQYQYVALVAMDATEETIRFMSTFPEVSLIEYDEVLYAEPDEESINICSIDELVNLKMSLTNTNNWTGSGIKVGVLEATDRYNGVWTEGITEDVDQLENADITWHGEISGLEYPQSSRHATVVTSLIVGQPTSSVYDQGIAPDATVIGVSFHNDNDFKNALDWLISQSVNVINMSFGFPTVLQYSENDRYVDQMIIQNNISVVKSAGNRGSSDGKITSPGHAYNAITVGGVSRNEIAIWSGSSYNQSDVGWETNKPEISALCSATVPVNATQAYNNENGTSFAAPRVTATLALMMEANDFLKTNPVYAKAVLLAGADFNGVSSANSNALISDSQFIRNKSGVGMLNTANACSLADSSAYCGSVINLKQDQWTGEYMTYTRSQLNVTAGQKIRVVLCYSMPECFSTDTYSAILTNEYENNLDMYIITGGVEVASSTSTRNIIEVIEYTTTQTGQHRVRIDLTDFSQAGDELPDAYRFLRYAVSYRVVP